MKSGWWRRADFVGWRSPANWFRVRIQFNPIAEIMPWIWANLNQLTEKLKGFDTKTIGSRSKILGDLEEVDRVYSTGIQEDPH